MAIFRRKKKDVVIKEQPKSRSIDGITVEESDFVIETIYNRNYKGKNINVYSLDGDTTMVKPTVNVPPFSQMFCVDPTNGNTHLYEFVPSLNDWKEI